jgi:predicted Zn-ribbon and HTH transcriptional regulator
MIAIGILERRAKKRRALRLKNNQCVNCGYDLRASTGRCSECGTEIPIPAQRATNPLA